LLDLGAQEFFPRALGDEQHKQGILTEFKAWSQGIEAFFEKRSVNRYFEKQIPFKYEINIGNIRPEGE
jgi:hypothetical protein